MNPDFIKALGYAAGAIIGVPFAYACFRAGQFFGSFREAMQTLETLATTVARHETEINQIKTERATERRVERDLREDGFLRRHFSRREGDPPPSDGDGPE